MDYGPWWLEFGWVYLVLKLDNLFKNGGRRKIVLTIMCVCVKLDSYYVNKESIYAKNKHLYAITSQCNVLNQLQHGAI
jgi:hypothetical protein